MFSKFIKELTGKRIEGELIQTALIALVTSLAVIALLYWVMPAAIMKNILFIIMVAASYSIIMPTIRQARAYRQFPCMSGMMIGMTTGMIAGFLPGYYVGATNGMFIGSMLGMATGIMLGCWKGSYCGVMGFLEGIMSGFMGGLMGAMTSVMLLFDHLIAASFAVFAVSSVIMLGLNYLIYQETLHEERKHRESHLITVLISGLLTLATVLIMAVGPRSALFG